MKFFTFVIFLFAAVFCRADGIELSPAEHIHYKTDGSNLVGYLDIPRDKPIDQSTYLYVKFALEEYIKQGVIFVYLRLNTPGGEVFPSIKIAELLQNLDTVHHIPVVAVIDNWALSAGAMLAYSCRYIAVSNTGLMGAAEPVTSGAEGKMESAPEKIVSALRAEFATLAKFYGRNPLIATAMVDKDIILIKKGSEIIQLKEESDVKSSGKNATQWITTRGKLLTLDAEQLIDLKVADFTVMPGGETTSSHSLLFSHPYFSKIPDVEIVSYSDWKIDFFAFLTHPMVSSLLMMGLMIGVYMEMSHPGFGLPGIIAITCLALILVSSFATQVINWLEILFVIIGVLLFLIEIFVLPGFGLLGAVGIVLILFGLVTMMLPNIQSIQFTWNWHEWDINALEFFERLAYYSGALILSLLFMVLFSRYVTPRLMKKSRIVLEGDQEGSVAGPEKSSLPPVGSEGEAFTSLHPGGKVLIKNQFHDASASVGFIEKGEKVIVIKIVGSAIIVAKK